MNFDSAKFVDIFRKEGSISSIISLKKLQVLQDRFCDLTGYGSVLMAQDGSLLTEKYHIEDRLLENEELRSYVKKEVDSNMFYVIEERCVYLVPVVVKAKFFGSFVFVVPQHLRSEEELEKAIRFTSFFYSILDNLLLSGFRAYEYREHLLQRIEEEKKLEQEKEELQHKNDYDELTGLYSRSYFNLACKNLETQTDKPICVVMCDVNNLKITNDLFGHRHGDKLLSTIAKVLLEQAHPGSVIARTGGDEISILMPGALRRDANWYCHEVTNALQKVLDCCITPSISMGVGKRSEESQSLKEIMNIADVKMYRNKMEYKSKLNVIDEIYNLMIRKEFITQDYTDRVAELGEGFCEYISYNKGIIDSVKIIARLHELGSTILPEKIYFSAPDELTLVERREYFKHSDVGAKIAMISKETEQLASTIANLHERWDGKGFPKNTKENDIPEFSRIMQIVIKYSRLVETSRMGSGLSSKEAKANIREAAGTEFDPDLAEKFLKYLETVEK